MSGLPVGRWSFPFGRRGDVLAVCAFAAMAEERARAPEFEGRRRAELDLLAGRLEGCATRPDHPVFAALGDTIRRRKVPIRLFRDIIGAARQDSVKFRYESLEELAEYCRMCSCPVGRTILHLADNWDARAAVLMDALCTGVKLARLWRNIPEDHACGRSYIPRREAAEFGVDVDMIVTGHRRGRIDGLVRRLVGYARGYFETSRSLMGILKCPLRYDCAASWHEGMTILGKADRLGKEALDFGPPLTLADRALILGRAVFGRL